MAFCNLCHDRGVIVQNELAVICSCRQQRTLVNRLKESGLPLRMQACTFDDFNFKYYSRKNIDPAKGTTFYELAKITFKAAKDFVARFKQNNYLDGLFLTGPVGGGKTFLACCIANSLIKEGYQVLFIVVPDLLDQLRATYEPGRLPGDDTEADILAKAQKTPLLILDDLGAHNYTEWTRNKLYSIFNYRLNNCLPLIITSNIKLEDLEDYLGERTTSRLYQMCRPYRLLIDVDIRMVQRGEKI